MQRQRSRVQRRNVPSFKIGIVLLVMLSLTWFFIRGIEKSGLPAGLAGIINADFENFKNLEQFDSAKIEEMQKTIAGFWTFSEGDTAKSPVAKREYLELNANGMVWHVSDWFINAPNGDAHKITHAAMGYIKPYSYSPDNESIFCETRVIRQAYVADADTCYGASQVDEIWQLNKPAQGGVISVNQREYKQYSGELTAFFPDPDVLDIVDMITLRACPAIAGMPFFGKKLLARSIDPVPFFTRAQSVETLIRDHYKPMVFDELARRYDPRAVPDEMAVQLTLSPDGAVKDMKHRSAKLVTKRFDELAVIDMKGWLFPPVGDTEEAQTLDLTVKVK